MIDRLRQLAARDIAGGYNTAGSTNITREPTATTESALDPYFREGMDPTTMAAIQLFDALSDLNTTQKESLLALYVYRNRSAESHIILTSMSAVRDKRITDLISPAIYTPYLAEDYKAVDRALKLAKAIHGIPTVNRASEYAYTARVIWQRQNADPDVEVSDASILSKGSAARIKTEVRQMMANDLRRSWGIMEGMAQEERLEVAKRCLETGISIATVCGIVDLPEKIIKKLRKDLQQEEPPAKIEIAQDESLPSGINEKKERLRLAINAVIRQEGAMPKNLAELAQQIGIDRKSAYKLYESIRLGEGYPPLRRGGFRRRKLS